MSEDQLVLSKKRILAIHDVIIKALAEMGFPVTPAEVILALTTVVIDTENYIRRQKEMEARIKSEHSYEA